MIRNATAAVPPPVPVAVTCAAPARSGSDPSGVFAGIAAIGAAFAGFVAHSRNPDLLSTGITVGFTFFAALFGLFVLHVVYRVAVALAKVAIPVGLVLLIGCAMHCRWAETTVRWLKAAGERGIAAATHGYDALESGAWSTARETR